MKETSKAQTSTRRKTRWALIAGLTVALLATSGLALADKGKFKGGHGRGGFPGMIMRAFGDLELTEQQELKAIRIRRNLQTQALEQRREMAGSIAKVADELEKPNPDATKLHGIADDVIKRISKLVHSGIDQVLELHATLSPEQRSTLTERLRGFQQRAEGEGKDLWRPKNK